MALDAQLVQTWVCFLLVWLLAILVWKWMHRPRNLPPGPPGRPLVGAMMELRDGNLHHDFMQYGDKYGDVFSLYIANSLMVVLNSHRAIKQAFLSQGPNFSDRPEMYVNRFTDFKDPIFMQSYTREWNKRKYFGSSTLRASMCNVEENVQFEIETVIKELLSYRGQPFEPKPVLSKATLNVITYVLFSTRYGNNDPDGSRLLEVITEWYKKFSMLALSPAIELLPYPLAKLLFYKKAKEIKDATDELRGIIASFIKEHRETFDVGNMRDVVDVYIKEGTLKSEEELVDMILLLFPDAVHVVSLALTWILLYLSHYQHVQDKIHKEIESAVDKNRPVTLAAKFSLNYTQACIEEILRSVCIFPLSAPHKPARDTVLDGYNIPANATVLANLYAASVDPEVWQDPQVFRPERFMDENQRFTKRNCAFTFGTGHRACMGESYVRTELLLFTSNLIQRFSFSFEPDQPEPTLEPQRPVFLFNTPVPFRICATPR